LARIHAPTLDELNVRIIVFVNLQATCERQQHAERYLGAAVVEVRQNATVEDGRSNAA
jgi:hypothetical protein